MKRFKSAGQPQRFLSAHDGINNLFHLRRDHLPADQYRAMRTEAFQASEPEYKQELLQYNDNQLALLITGERGAKFDWKMHKYSPTEFGNEGVIKTKSGNNYYVFTDRDKSYLVNARGTHEQQKIKAASGEYPLKLPPMEFGKPAQRFWKRTQAKDKDGTPLPILLWMSLDNSYYFRH